MKHVAAVRRQLGVPDDLQPARTAVQSGRGPVPTAGRGPAGPAAAAGGGPGSLGTERAVVVRGATGWTR